MPPLGRPRGIARPHDRPECRTRRHQPTGHGMPAPWPSGERTFLRHERTERRSGKSGAGSVGARGPMQPHMGRRGSHFIPAARSADRTVRLKRNEFLIYSNGMRNSHRNTKRVLFKDLWYQDRCRPREERDRHGIGLREPDPGLPGGGSSRTSTLGGSVPPASRIRSVSDGRDQGASVPRDSTRSITRRRTLLSLIRTKALVSARPSVEVRKSVT